jgi:hypothetical protein
LKVLDNYLKWKVFDDLIDDIEHYTKNSWTFTTNLNSNSKEGDYQFSCELPSNSFLLKPFNLNNIIRAKINFFGRYETNKGLGMHRDLLDDDNYSTAIFYLNTNNGGTRFENDFVQSVANRLVLFDGPLYHETVVQTDSNIRMLFNINYRK